MKSPSRSKVCRPGSNDGGFVGRDDGAVGVADQVDVEVEGASVAVGSNRGNGRNSSVGKVGRGVGHVGSSMVAATGSKVIGTGSGNCRLVSWDDGAVGVADQGSVQVERPGVAVGNNGSSVGNTMCGGKSCEVFRSGCGNCWLVNWHHCAIGVTHLKVERVDGICS